MQRYFDPTRKMTSTKNGRLPKKKKKMEDDLKKNKKMEDDLNKKMKMGDDLFFFEKIE